MQAQLELDSLGVPALLTGCVENLLASYDEREALFPYSSKLVGGGFVNDYANPLARRYTINTLLGLAAAARVGIAGLDTRSVRSMTVAFLERQRNRIDSPADLGLLALLLDADADEWAPQCASLVDEMGMLLSRVGRRRLNMQDLSWMLWGACAVSRGGSPEAAALAGRLFERLDRYFVDGRTELPRHSVRGYRRRIVSFGSLVYFLRAMHEYEEATGSARARTLFENGVDRAMAIQGPRGEWPWMIDVATGRPFDAYPIFSVHQDSMAMLFLLPAYDRGDGRAACAIRRSLEWGFGSNELGMDFYPRDPFHAYRSIERTESAARFRRYVRALTHSVRDSPVTFSTAGARLNPECRSYHLGWILFAWADRPELIQTRRADSPSGGSEL